MGDHDWYCYDCHRPGSVLECSECWRVFHPTCTDDYAELENEDTFVCAVCKVPVSVSLQCRGNALTRNDLSISAWLTDLHEIFREGWQWVSEQMVKFWWRSGSLSGRVLAWLSLWSEMQMICIWSSWCHCHPISLAPVKFRMVYLCRAGLPRLS